MVITGWDLRGKQSAVTSVIGHEGDIFAVAHAPGTEVLATGGVEGIVRLLNVKTLESVGTTFRVGAPVASLCYGPEGKRLYAGLSNWKIAVLDPATGAIEKELAAHTGSVLALAVTGDGQTLYSGSEDGTIRTWDLATGEIRRSIPFGAEVFALATTPDGSTLYAAGSGNEVRAYDIEGSVSGTFTLPSGGGHALALDAEATTLYVAAVAGVHAVSTSDLKTAKRFKGATSAMLSLALSADGKWVLAGDAGGGVWLWPHVRPERPDFSNLAAHTGPVTGVTL
jgi:WD40 repeat protein